MIKNLTTATYVNNVNMIDNNNVNMLDNNNVSMIDNNMLDNLTTSLTSSSPSSPRPWLWSLVGPVVVVGAGANLLVVVTVVTTRRLQNR